MDTATVSLIGSALLFVGSLITLFLNRRGVRADTLSKLDAIIDKVQIRADKLYDEKVACEIAADKLRGEHAIALVTIADLKTELANLNGYIQGITDPLIKLEQSQKRALVERRKQ